MILLTQAQSIYVTLSIIGGAVIIALLLFFLYRNCIKRKVIKRIVARRLYHCADLNDYLLLNDYEINLDDKNVGVIDHILITNKFIITINDFSLSGVLSGSFEEDTVRYTNKKEDKYIPNPLNYNRNLSKRLALFFDLDNSLIRGLSIINDDSVINASVNQTQYCVIRLKELFKAIKEIDQEAVKPLKENSIVSFINILNDRNGERRR